MRLASFSVGGRATFGIVDGNEVVDLGRSQFPDLRSLLESGGAGPALAQADGPRTPIDQVEFLPILPNADAKIFCLGWAYASHREETGHKVDEFPFFFLKHPQALVGHKQPLTKPGCSDMFDFEGELTVVIGKAGRNIPERDAMDHVAGYTILMDGSVRDWQKHSPTAGKNFEGSTPYGPWLVTKDEVPDPHALRLTTRLNGQTMQDAPTADLIWKIPYLVSYCSKIIGLKPGDAIATGTPGGVGAKRTPPIFMKPGDLIEVEVSGIGKLTNTVHEERG
jgi:2-keto-4-pentenoate hydratase/2-oxohepta-3-ene-1,7-dioic acid hydratase in catechol pathway